MSGTTDAIERAKIEAEQARKQLANTMGTMQYRLRPGNLMSDAWDGVRDKSSALADDAVQAVKDRPAAASGVVAAIALFLAREPIYRAVSRLFASKDTAADDGLITADLITVDENYDLTAPSVARSLNEGVSA